MDTAAMTAAILHIDLVLRYCVHHSFTLLQLALCALHKFGHSAHSIKVTRPGKGSAQLGDLPCHGSFVNCDHIATCDLLLLKGIDHLRTEVVDIRNIEIGGLWAHVTASQSDLDKERTVGFGWL